MKKLFALLLTLVLLGCLAGCQMIGDLASQWGLEDLLGGILPSEGPATEPPHTHRYASSVIKPTCTEGGYTTYTCSCGDSYQDKETAASGHDYVNRICRDCGENAPDSAGLEFALDEETQTYYVVSMGSCQDTNVIIPETYQGVLVTGIGPSAFHGSSITGITIPSGVVIIGSGAFGDCGVLATVGYGGTMEQWLAMLENVNLGLGEGRYTMYFPGNDGHIHSYVTRVDPATCTDSGYISYTCNCGDSYSKTIPGSHSYKKEVTKEPTCAEKGAATYTCNHCGNTYSDTISKLPHTYTETVTEPTCTAEGATVYLCVCGDTYTEAIAKLPHTYTETVTEPTCTEKGYTTHTCHCGDSSVSDYTDALGHNFVNKVCTRCGAEELNPSEGLKFTLTSDKKSYYVTGIGSCTDTDIVIPAEYEGRPVIGIDFMAFYKCSSLTSIEIPDSVTSIGWDAFSQCSSLTSIEIPDGVTSIGYNAFYGCGSLTSVTIGNGVTSIGDDAFYGCSSLTSVTIGNGATSIGYAAFSGCRSLTSITIPDSVTFIDYNAFAWCESLTNIHFEGTIAQWRDISKNRYWDDHTGDYTVYCTDGEIPKE